MENNKSEVIQGLMLELNNARKAGDRTGEGIGYFNLGNAYCELCNYRKALEYYTQALSIAEEVEDKGLLGQTLGIVGGTHALLGNLKEAIVYHEQELSIAKEIGDRAGEGRAYEDLGQAYRGLGNFKQAIAYYKQHLSIAGEIGDRAGEGKAYANLGRAYQCLGNFKQAIEYHEQRLSIAQETGDRADEGIAYGGLGNASHGLGNFEQAIEYHRQSLSIAKEIGDRDAEGIAYAGLGNSYYGLCNFKQAIEYHRQHLSITKEIGERNGERKAYGNMGNAFQRQSNFKQAIEYHEQELSIAKEIGDRAGEGEAYENLGIANTGLGSFKQAIVYHRQHLSISKEIGDRAGEGKANGNLGNAYYHLGNFTQAIECHELHLSIAKEIEDRAGEGKAYGDLGVVYTGLGNLKQAIEYHEQCLGIAKEMGNIGLEKIADSHMGHAYYSLGNFKQAIKYQEEHLGIAKAIGDRAGEGSACINLGNAYYHLGNFKEAIEYHKQCLSIAKETGERSEEAIACCSLGLDYELSGSFYEAVDYYQSTVEILDNTRDLQSEDAWKIEFCHLFRYLYTGLWRTLLLTGDTDGALCAAEKGRAQALRDILQRNYGIEELISTSFNHKGTITSISNCLSTQTVFMALVGNTITFWVLRNGEEIVVRQKKIETESATMLMETMLKEIGAGVDVRCEDRSLEELNDDSPTNREAVERNVPSSTTSVNPLRPLYDVIIDPIADLIQGDQLIIVPDGPFCLTPYPALSESIRIHTVPSLTALKLIAGSPQDFHSKSGALLVGDPCMEEVPIKLSQLPCARKEVDMIGELLKTTPLTGRNATKGEVLKHISSVALVHIAAHGCQETGEIALAPNPNRVSQIPKQDDFILTMSDVQAVRLRARLVVLSCCHSGRGEVKSEGVVGIARAFLCAGARSVLVSLWAIDDEATLLFMKTFYQILADGESTSVALHQAMKSLRESRKFGAVKHWAPFSLIGDDVTVEFRKQH